GLLDVMLTDGSVVTFENTAPLAALVANVPAPSRNALLIRPPFTVNVLVAATEIVPPFMRIDRVVVVVAVKLRVPAEVPVTVPAPRAASAATATVPFWMRVPPV